MPAGLHDDQQFGEFGLSNDEGAARKRASLAADFTAQCVELTLQNPEHVFYGVEFERALPSLSRRLGL